MSEKLTFILAGNGPYDNRGCEAIVRGTVKILRNYYKDPSFLCVSFFQSQEQFEKQSREEYDPEITHKKANTIYKRFSLMGGLKFAQEKITPKEYIYSIYKELFPFIRETEAVLSIGGDNYSLDYRPPLRFTGLDDLVLKEKKPIIIWGASVGPFDKLPEYERYMKNHLQNITGIFARESATIEYLKKIGVTENVYKVSDPAFLMDATEPQFREDLKIEEDSIGINLSPLMARYVNDNNMESWINTSSKIVERISKYTEGGIYLIPHVVTPYSNDYLFLKEVRARLKDQDKKIRIIPPIYNASETKWIISQMKLFAGSRTHSTIASLSSLVPTISFAYSIKAKGINKDIFGHEDYCLDPTSMNPETVAKKVEFLLENQDEIKSILKNKIPMFENEAYKAGLNLKNIVN